MPGGARHRADQGRAARPGARHRGDQTATLPTKPPISIGTFNDAVIRRFNDGQQPAHVRDVARSKVWRYEFEPQDCKLSVGAQATDVDTHQGVGEVVGLDAVEGWLELKLGRKREPARPRGLGPDGPINVAVLRDAVARVSRQVLAGQWPLGRARLERRVPDDLVARAGERPRDVVVRAGRSLRGQVLAVQGPPGSGKTTVGAQLTRALLDDGFRVGVTAQSHAVVGNLLKAADRPALQRCPPEDKGGSDAILLAGDNGAVVAHLAFGTANLIGGSAWLWAREDMQDTVDVLVIEAGQFSLANAVAVSGAARSLVLLGDPQQLTQPTPGRPSRRGGDLRAAAPARRARHDSRRSRSVPRHDLAHAPDDHRLRLDDLLRRPAWIRPWP